jgi:sulfur-carrier protein
MNGCHICGKFFMVSVQLPSQLSGLAEGNKRLEVEASSLKEVFERIDKIAPMIRSQVFDKTGAIRQFVGIFLDGRQIIDWGDGSQTVRNESQILIVMSVAGG